MRKIVSRALLITLFAAGGPIAIAMLRGDGIAPILGALVGCFVLFIGVVLLARLVLVASEKAGWHRLARVLGREVGRSHPSDT